MRICLLGSGSRGNSIYVECRSSAIIIDQGFSYKELEKRMVSKAIDPARIKAILVTHEHEDHMKGVGITARKLDIPVFATGGTLNGKRNIFNGRECLNPIESGEPFTLGPFEILPYRVSHDAVDPVQYCIRSGKKKVTVATDLGFVSTLVEQCLRGSDLIIVEANHDIDMLRKGSYPWALKQRIMSKTGHLSNKNAAEIIFNIVSPKGKPGVVLAHLSEENNRPDLAEKEVRDLFERFDKRLERLIIAPQYEATDIIEI